MLRAQELEVWFLSHVWCPAPISQYAISSKSLPKMLFQIFKEYLWAKLQAPVLIVWEGENKSCSVLSAK